MVYTTRAKVEALTNLDLSAIDSSVTAWILSVSAWIDRYTGRKFGATDGSEMAEPETRYYDGNGRNRIFIDPLIITADLRVSVLKSNGEVERILEQGAGNDYLLYPLNTEEKTEIVLMGNSPVRYFSRAFFDDILDDEDINDPAFTTRRLIEVVGTFYASDAVPADIELAATKLVAAIAQQRETAGAGIKSSESLGDYSVSYSSTKVDEAAEILGVKNILDQWREPTI